jgi:hypothetical protein
MQDASRKTLPPAGDSIHDMTFSACLWKNHAKMVPIWWRAFGACTCLGANAAARLCDAGRLLSCTQIPPMLPFAPPRRCAASM